MAISIPTEPSDRRKFLIAVGVIGVCAIWLVYYLSTHLSFSQTAKPLDSPGWKTANEITAKLNADRAFQDVVLGVASEDPPTFNVLGAVHSKADLDRLAAALKEADPNASYEMKVEILPR